MKTNMEKERNRWPEATTCPHCDRVVASRRRTTCGFCGEALPYGTRFSLREAREVAARVDATKTRLASALEEREREFIDIDVSRLHLSLYWG